MIQREMGNETGKRSSEHSESHQASDRRGDRSFPVLNPGEWRPYTQLFCPRGEGAGLFPH